MDDLDWFPVGTCMEEVRLPSGLKMRWYAHGPAGEAPIVLCLHGFPELAVSWRAQLAGLSDRYRVVAPDMRGYGGTDAPGRVADYRMEHLRDFDRVIIEEAGHWVQQEAPGRVNAALAEHFQRA